MFTRQFHRLRDGLRTVRALSSRRLHQAAAARVPPAPSGSLSLRLALGGACLAAAAAAHAALAPAATTECEPVPAASSAAASANSGTTTTASTGSDEVITFYTPTSSGHAEQLPPDADLSSYSLEQLGSIYDPTKKEHSLLHNLAHELVWGTTAPAEGLDPIELRFTAANPNPAHRHMELLMRTIQDRICNDLLEVEQRGGATLHEIDGTPVNDALRQLLLAQTVAPGQFRQDVTLRPDGSGGGIARVLSGGRVFAKAGVSVSVASVQVGKPTLQHYVKDHPQLKECLATFGEQDKIQQFTAAVSLVLHPVNPHVPTVHANFRFFDLHMPDGRNFWWFGGGSDLTPTYVVDEEARFFHKTIKDTLDPIDPTYYPTWKKQADTYFFVRHRNETRGIGGVFFDNLHTQSQSHYAEMIRRLGESFSAQYFPIVLRAKDRPFTPADLAFQQLRRGRYVEFNVMYDRGTSHGLLVMPHQRVDAVLMSLPPIVRYAYKQPFNQTNETAYTKEVLTTPKDWC